MYIVQHFEEPHYPIAFISIQRRQKDQNTPEHLKMMVKQSQFHLGKGKVVKQQYPMSSTMNVSIGVRCGQLAS